MKLTLIHFHDGTSQYKYIRELSEIQDYYEMKHIKSIQFLETYKERG